MTKMDIEEAIRDYSWMVREIERLGGFLSGAGERVVRSYGPDSDMPKAKGITSNPVHAEVERREKQWKRMDKLLMKVNFIQERIESITDERERTVLDCMLDGMSFTSIAYHLRLSKSYVGMLKDNIVNQLYNTKKETA